MNASHALREVAPEPFVKVVQADIQFAAPISDPARCLTALNAALPGAHVDFTTLVRSKNGDSERILFVVVSQDFAVAVGESGLIIDTVRYGAWEAFRSKVASVLEAMASITPIDTEHVSLHYFDEVRLSPGRSEPADFQPYVRFPLLPADDLLRAHVRRSFGGYRFKHEIASVSMEWTLTSDPALPPAHPLFDRYETSEIEVLAMDWGVHLHASSALQALDDAYAAISAVFWDTLTDDGRVLMGLTA